MPQPYKSTDWSNTQNLRIFSLTGFLLHIPFTLQVIVEVSKETLKSIGSAPNFNRLLVQNGKKQGVSRVIKLAQRYYAEENNSTLTPFKTADGFMEKTNPAQSVRGCSYLFKTGRLVVRFLFAFLFGDHFLRDIVWRGVVMAELHGRSSTTA